MKKRNTKIWKKLNKSNDSEVINHKPKSKTLNNNGITNSKYLYKYNNTDRKLSR